MECELLTKACLICSSSTCFECAYPYMVKDGTCQFEGWIGFSSEKYTVLDSATEVSITVESLF